METRAQKAHKPNDWQTRAGSGQFAASRGTCVFCVSKVVPGNRFDRQGSPCNGQRAGRETSRLQTQARSEWKPRNNIRPGTHQRPGAAQDRTRAATSANLGRASEIRPRSISRPARQIGRRNNTEGPPSAGFPRLRAVAAGRVADSPGPQSCWDRPACAPVQDRRDTLR